MGSLLRTRRLVWAVILATVTVLITFTYLSGRRYVAAVESVRHTLEVTSATGRVVAALGDEETAQRGFLLTGDEAFLRPRHSGQRAAVEALAELERLTADDPMQHAAVRELAEDVRVKQAFVSQVIELARAGERETALELVRQRRGMQLMDAIREQSAKMLAEERRQLEVRSNLAMRTQQFTFGAILLGALIAAGLLLASFRALRRDTIRLRLAAEELAESEERFRVLADSASDIVCVYELDGSIWYQSPSTERLLGFSLDELAIMPRTELIHPDDLAESEAVFRKVAADEEDSGVLVHRLRCKNGSYRWFETHLTRLAGHPPRIQMTARDVTQRRLDTEALALAADQMRTLSLRDELTGLYNRRGFFELGEQLVRVASRERRSLALVFVDLDGLKPINDEHGHEAGDRAILEAAELLRGVCRASDVVVRLGGDELAVLALDLDPNTVSVFRARTELALATRNAAGDLPFQLSFSMGAAFRATDRNEPLETLLARADAAMYAEKRQRRLERGHRTSRIPERARPSLPVTSSRSR